MVVAIGNSESDIAMMEKADIRIGYGGIKEVMPEILSTVDYAIYEEKKIGRISGTIIAGRKNDIIKDCDNKLCWNG